MTQDGHLRFNQTCRRDEVKLRKILPLYRSKDLKISIVTGFVSRRVWNAKKNTRTQLVSPNGNRADSCAAGVTWLKKYLFFRFDKSLIEWTMSYVRNSVKRQWKHLNGQCKQNSTVGMHSARAWLFEKKGIVIWAHFFRDRRNENEIMTKERMCEGKHFLVERVSVDLPTSLINLSLAFAVTNNSSFSDIAVHE